MLDPASQRVFASAPYGGSLVEFLGEDEPSDDDRDDWYIRGLVARDVIGFLAGDAKVGKTMIAESWAVALAKGAPEWCGCPVYERKRVLFLAHEDSERTTRKRLWHLARGAGLGRRHDLDGWLEVDCLTPLDLVDSTHIAQLRAACERFDVVIVDSLTSSHRGDENAAKDIARVMTPLRHLAASTRTAIVLVHHFNGKGRIDSRGVKNRMRGSSALAGYARHIVGASSGTKHGQVLLASDGNLAHQLKPLLIERVSGVVDGKQTLHFECAAEPHGAPRFQKRNDEIMRVVRANPGGFTSASAIFKAAGGNKSAVMAAIKRELEPGGQLEFRGDGIYCRLAVPGTAENRLVTSTGSGSPPLRVEPGTGNPSGSRAEARGRRSGEDQGHAV